MKSPSRVKRRHTPVSGFADKINAYLSVHGQALFSSLGRLLRTPATFAMTVAVMAIALSLATGFYLLVANIEQLTDKLEASNQISVFLQPEVTAEQGQILAEKLKQNPKINQVLFISKQKGLEEFKQFSGFGEALEALEGNPLPNVIQVLPLDTLTDDQWIKALTQELEALPKVDFVQVDMQWLKRLQAIIRVANRGVLILSSVLALAILFIIGNTIRLELQNRKQEVLIEKLVGATQGFIQRPFLYSGFWYGFIAGLSAWILITVIILLIQAPLEQLSELYDEQFDIRFLSIMETLILLSASAGLGVLGAWIVLHRQLQQLKPE